MSDTQDELAGFLSASSDEPVPELIPETASEEPEVEIEPEAEPETEPEVAEDAPAEEQPAPEYITKAEYDALQSQLAQLQAQSQEEIRRIHGKYGELHRELQQRPSGVKLSKEKLKRTYEQYPEIAELLAEDFSDVEVGGGIDESRLQQLVDQRLQQQAQPINQQMEMLKLTVAHPDWRNVASSQEWNAYVSSLPAEEQQAMANTWDSEYLSRVFTNFKSSQQQAKETPVAPKASAKSKVIQAAVTPQGSKAPMPATNSELDAFLKATTK
jgi:hypothetical protein